MPNSLSCIKETYTLFSRTGPMMTWRNCEISWDIFTAIIYLAPPVPWDWPSMTVLEVGTIREKGTQLVNRANLKLLGRRDRTKLKITDLWDIKLFLKNTVPAVYCHVTVWQLILSIYPRRAMTWQMQYHPVQCMSLAWSILGSSEIICTPLEMVPLVDLKCGMAYEVF